MRKLYIIIALLLGFIAPRAMAQIDPHFTQYYAFPLYLNPALTGVIDGQYRVAGNFRNQWASIATPISSKGLTADMPIGKGFGVGLMVMNQTAGDGGYFYNNVTASVSYQIQLAEHQILAAGFQAGFINRGINQSKLQFGNQFNPILGFDPTLPTNEAFSNATTFALDVNAGLMYYDRSPSKNINPFLGVSVFHPNKPKDKFLAATTSYVPMRLTMHGGLKLKLSDAIDLTPHAIYIKQGTASEYAGGLNVNYSLDTYKDFIVGATYRYKDAVAPNIGIHINGLIIGLSYDVNVSNLNAATSSRGGFELSMSFIGRNKIAEPKFICPRL
jgi:type IX secretion system PorP/SprF family membrane protein